MADEGTIDTEDDSSLDDSYIDPVDLDTFTPPEQDFPPTDDNPDPINVSTIDNSYTYVPPPASSYNTGDTPNNSEVFQNVANTTIWDATTVYQAGAYVVDPADDNDYQALPYIPNPYIPPWAATTPYSGGEIVSLGTGAGKQTWQATSPSFDQDPLFNSGWNGAPNLWTLVPSAGPVNQGYRPSSNPKMWLYVGPAGTTGDNDVGGDMYCDNPPDAPTQCTPQGLMWVQQQTSSGLNWEYQVIGNVSPDWNE